MSVPAGSVMVRRCYLADRRTTPEVWRVIRIFPDGKVQYQSRLATEGRKQIWRREITTIALLVAAISREAPSDWTPEWDQEQGMR